MEKFTTLLHRGRNPLLARNNIARVKVEGRRVMQATLLSRLVFRHFMVKGRLLQG